MGHVWDMYGICMGYVWDMYGISKEKLRINSPTQFLLQINFENVLGFFLLLLVRLFLSLIQRA